jgi:hypothetical protein
MRTILLAIVVWLGVIAGRLNAISHKLNKPALEPALSAGH